jgi:hypothetical protein
VEAVKAGKVKGESGSCGRSGILWKLSCTRWSSNGLTQRCLDVSETLLYGGMNSSHQVTSKVKNIYLVYFLCFVDDISVLILLLLVFLLCLGVLLGSAVRVLQHRVAHHLLVFSDTKQVENLKILVSMLRIRDPVPF